MRVNVSNLLKPNHFKLLSIGYDGEWIFTNSHTCKVLVDDMVNNEVNENNSEVSWTTETEDIHQETTKTGWIDVYERERVNETFGKLFVKKENLTIVEFGASEGYMIEEMSIKYPANCFVATDLLLDGLTRSAIRNPDIMHIQCDFTDAPFETSKLIKPKFGVREFIVLRKE